MNLLKKLLPRDSFYLILFVCVGILGASAIWVSKEKVNDSQREDARLESNKEIIEEEIKLDLNEKHITKKPEVDKNTTLEVVPPIEDVAEVEKVVEKPIEKPVEQPIVKKKIEKPKQPEVAKVEQAKPIVKKPEAEAKTEVASSSSVEVAQKLKRPVEGKVSKDFSRDKLVYSKTLDEWSTHLGMDLLAIEGTNVVSALDGVVKHITRDENLGVTIVIDHGNGLETVYKNVSNADLVKTGQSVKTGETITKVSKGVGFEKLDEPHLHFEVLKDGKHIDPKSLF